MNRFAYKKVWRERMVKRKRCACGVTLTVKERLLGDVCLPCAERLRARRAIPRE